MLYSYSGRLRGRTPDSPGTHAPIIRIAMEPTGFQDNITQPFPASEAWQWVSHEVTPEQLAWAENMTVVLAVEPVSAGASATGTAFFDDLSVTFSSTGSCLRLSAITAVSCLVAHEGYYTLYSFQ